MRIKNKASFIFIILLVLSLCVLLYASLLSGTSYQYDSDEYYHSEVMYLLTHGETLFQSIYSVYSPVFYWLLTPVYRLTDFTLTSLAAGRWMMAGLFLVRLFAQFFLLKKLVSVRAGLLSVFLSLLDPFTNFSAMQIRPDNLMMLFWSVGITFLSYTWLRVLASSANWRNQHKVVRIFPPFLSGFFLSLSAISLIKIAPSVGVMILFFFWFLAREKQWHLFRWFFIGVVAPVLCFVGVLGFQGIFSGYVQGAILDPFMFMANILYPVAPGFFYQPNNIFIYGLSGKPIGWWIAQFIPILSFIGIGMIAQTQNSLFRQGFGGQAKLKTQKEQQIFTSYFFLALVAAFAAQYALLLASPSAFMQYYLPIMWFYAVFGVIALEKILTGIGSIPKIGGIIILGTGICFLILSIKSMHIQLLRATYTSDATLFDIQAKWKKIGEDQAVYPMLLFRPLSTPFLSHNIFEVPKPVQERYPSLPQMLEEENVQYIFPSEFLLSHLSQTDRQYIRSHYVSDETDPTMLVRKK